MNQEIGQNLNNTVWNNKGIFKDIEDPSISKAFQEIRTWVGELRHLDQELANKKITDSNLFFEQENQDLLKKFLQLKNKLEIECSTIGTYANLCLSKNSSDPSAQKVYAEAKKLFSETNQALKGLYTLLAQMDPQKTSSLFRDLGIEEFLPEVLHLQKFQDFLLPTELEKTIESLALYGLNSWGNLYSDISGQIKIQWNGQILGLAQGNNLMDMDDPFVREQIYRLMNQAWQQHEVSVAAVLNAIYGWRLETNQMRSSRKELHFLDHATFKEKLNPSILNALMTTTEKFKDQAQEAMKIMAREMGKEKLGPWDLLAGYPPSGDPVVIPFDRGMELIIEAFSEFSQEMADFAEHAWKNSWIDSGPSENRRTGAFCSTFLRTRESRIFITYDGTIKNLTTLAHELGHAYHNFVLKDLPIGKSKYSASVAETASIFAETLLRNHLLRKSQSREERKQVLWQELSSITSLMLNIPARFDFEKSMMEQRKKGFVSVPEVKNLCRDSWKKWYADTLSEYNDMFWASKLHFSIPEMSFYNYPYLFGYLFSLGIYAQREKLGSDFAPLYKNLLKDTGVLTASELIQKYFQKDISKPEFWEDSLRLALKSIGDYRKEMSPSISH